MDTSDQTRPLAAFWGQTSRRIKAYPLTGIVVLSLAIKIVLMVALADKPPNYDGIIYLSAAQEIEQGNLGAAIKIYRMPAYPILLAAGYRVFHDWMLSARCIAFLSLITATIILYHLTTLLFDARSAFWAGLAFSLTPFQNEMTVLAYRGPIYLVLVAAAVYCITRTIQEPTAKAVFWSAWLSLMPFLFRIEGVLLPPVFLVFLLFQSVISPGKRRPIVKGIGLWLGTLLVPIVIGGFLLDVDWATLSRISEIRHAFFRLFKPEGWELTHQIRAQLKAMEAASLIPGQALNFGEIARRHMGLIYLLGLATALLKAAYPIYGIPMAVGLRQGLGRQHAFAITFVAVYLGMLYLHLVQEDFTGRRFAFTPAVLLFPWVGAGLVRLWDHAGRHRFAKSMTALFVLLFVVLPLKGIVGIMEMPDRPSVDAGRWLASSPYRQCRLVANDPRIAFAAGIKLYGGTDQYLEFAPQDHDYTSLETLALAQKRPLIVLKLRHKRKARLPGFHHFVKIKEFEGPSKSVLVFLHRSVRLDGGPCLQTDGPIAGIVDP